jgi:type I site-specific restriction endonuclease
MLFVVDRNILADQAFNTFSPFPEDAVVRIDPDIKHYLRSPIPTSTRQCKKRCMKPQENTVKTVFFAILE